MCFAVPGEANQFQSEIPCRNRGGNCVTLTNARVDLHVHTDSLIRKNRKLLWFRPNVALRRPSLHIQNVIARWQCDTILSILVRRCTRDFLFAVLGQDDQWVFGIISIAELWRVSLRKLNIFKRKDPQMSLEETHRSVIRCQTADRNQKEATPNQVFETHDVQENGRDRFSPSRPSYKPNFTAMSVAMRSAHGWQRTASVHWEQS